MSYWREKVALVVGGSAGLGRVIAGKLAAEGAKTVIAALQGQELVAATDALAAAGGDVTAIPTDVTRQEQVDALFQQLLELHGRLDVLVNSAGRSARGEVLATKPEDFRQLLELNFLAVVRCTIAAAPHLLASRGHLVNIGSLGAKAASRYLGAYPASKFPLAAYCQQLRLELGPKGLHVLLVCPGPIAREDAGRRYDDQTLGLPESARLPGGGVRLKSLSPDKLAQRILQACQRRQPELVVPALARLLFAISQLSPSLGDWIIQKMT
jgi:NAD(P)-dependent dehydrogenase (short-subunit alcohol dehydrogenase family)